VHVPGARHHVGVGVPAGSDSLGLGLGLGEGDSPVLADGVARAAVLTGVRTGVGLTVGP
jgi:hypothetical protein